jgi:hypothetical protein
MNGNIFHDAAYLITGLIIWPICYASGFVIGLYRSIRERYKTSEV